MLDMVLTHLLTYSLTHSLTCFTLTYSLTHLLLGSFIAGMETVSDAMDLVALLFQDIYDACKRLLLLLIQSTHPLTH